MLDRFMGRTDEFHGHAFPMNLVHTRPEEAFVRKQVIEFSNIPTAAPGLEVSVGIGADVYVTADFPVDIYYGDSDHANCPHVLDARFVGLTKKIFIRQYMNIDYGRCVIFAAFPAIGSQFVRENPLLKPLLNYHYQSGAGWLATNPFVDIGGPVIPIICTPPVEAAYLREYRIERTAGVVTHCQFLELESGLNLEIHSDRADNPTNNFDVCHDNPVKLSSRFVVRAHGSILAANSGYTLEFKYHRI